MFFITIIKPSYMKNLFVMMMSSIMLLACSEMELSPSRNLSAGSDALKDKNQISQLDIGPVNPYVWTKYKFRS